MWIQLDPHEVGQIIAAVGNGPLADKLSKKEHPDAEKFREAADLSSDYVHIPVDAPIDRTRNGAYVLSWTWVYNESAGYMELTDFSNFDISEALRDKLDALTEFRIDDWDPSTWEADGAVDNQAWSLTGTGEELRFSVENAETAEVAWFHTCGRKSEDASEEALFSFVLDAVDKYRSDTEPAFPTR
jgi:hypothetical protein